MLAAQLGNHTGSLGVAIAKKLNATNAGAYAAACTKLDVRRGEQVLEIGLGNGREIPRILALAPHVIYWGIDVSETMVHAAADGSRICGIFRIDPFASGCVAFGH